MANKPIKRFNVGSGIHAFVWCNQSSTGGEWYTITISRTYKEGEQFKDATSFRRDDLLFVAKAADLAYQWCYWKADADQVDKAVSD
ncbi:MAG: hypothetical protein IT422_29660 [Pirellulaceae bacterium]|nr:hypothetical protein [Pirellulaceae bacterium]